MRVAERLQIGAKALQVVDRSGQVLSQLPGRFETLDHRADDRSLLVATLDKKRQHALLVRLQGKAWGSALYLPKTRFAIQGLCLFRDSARNDYLFLVGEEGIGEQWLVAENGKPLADARQVRALSLPPESGFCQVDDRSESLYVNEENVGVWRYQAGAEAALVREQVELHAPFGTLAEAAAGMAVLPDALLQLDIRSGFQLGNRKVDLAVASNRDHNSLHLFAIDPTTGELSDIGQFSTPLKEIYGLCLFKDRQETIHAIANDKDGTFLQYRLNGDTGKAAGLLVRRFKTQTQPEGCVADDRNERLYIDEEDVAVWALDAHGDAPPALEKVIAVGGPLKDDIEGLGLYHGKQRDYLVISSQGNDSYVVVEAQAPYRLRGGFRVGLNAQLGVDGASETDGLEVTSANLGGPWGAGMLVVQDGRKRMSEGNQNYKYVPWSAVSDALGLQ
ncbi:phytase [Pseudomonas chlororaphis]|nr:phytase [Pseudomonas chlororaphis]